MKRRFSIEQAVIFAGGRGERLRPLTDRMPKPMAPVNGRPFADHLLRSLVDAGIRKVLFLVGYRADVIKDYFGNGARFGLEVDYSVGAVEDQTGRRLLNAYEKLEEYFLLLYGDNYWPVPLGALVANYARLGLPVTTTVYGNKQGLGEYAFENNTIVGLHGKVSAYDKGRRMKGLNGVDIGFFLVDKTILDLNETENISFEERILAPLAAQGRLGAFMTDDRYYYITTFDDLARFERLAREKAFQPLVLKGGL